MYPQYNLVFVYKGMAVYLCMHSSAYKIIIPHCQNRSNIRQKNSRQMQNRHLSHTNIWPFSFLGQYRHFNKTWRGLTSFMDPPSTQSLVQLVQGTGNKCTNTITLQFKIYIKIKEILSLVKQNVLILNYLSIFLIFKTFYIQ